MTSKPIVYLFTSGRVEGKVVSDEDQLRKLCGIAVSVAKDIRLMVLGMGMKRINDNTSSIKVMIPRGDQVLQKLTSLVEEYIGRKAAGVHIGRKRPLKE